MSFSSKVKEELAALTDRARHCQTAELAAMISGIGRIHMQDGQMHITLTTENEQLAQKYIELLRQLCGICANPAQLRQNKISYRIDISGQEEVRKLFLLLKIMGADGHVRENMTLTDGLLLQKSCCKRAFLRGAFLSTGSMSDPRKSYHFEIVCENQEKAAQLQELFRSFELDAKVVTRKYHQVVYIKEGSQIVDALNIMGAHMALMDLENVRILKEMRNDINRRVNCETANINKTVSAAYRQQEAIRFLQRRGALRELPEQLQQMAVLRMENPEATIKELGELCLPCVGKSGVNHRLRKLEEIAEHMGYEKRE